MVAPIDTYKKHYEVKFQGDVTFSRKFMPQVRAVLDLIRLPKRVRNNEGTNLDQRGFDLTLMPLQIGVRVRRNFALKWDQFTQDDKERKTMSCDIYFLGYADETETQLVSYLVWDGVQYERMRDTCWIPLADRQHNQRHSMVAFNCYKNSDIARYCRVYAQKGKIAYQLTTL